MEPALSGRVLAWEGRGPDGLWTVFSLLVRFSQGSLCFGGGGSLAWGGEGCGSIADGQARSY